MPLGSRDCRDQPFERALQQRIRGPFPKLQGQLVQQSKPRVPVSSTEAAQAGAIDFSTSSTSVIAASGNGLSAGCLVGTESREGISRFSTHKVVSPIRMLLPM